MTSPSHDLDQQRGVPDQPEAPDGPVVPDVPEAPDGPVVPDAPVAPDGPEVADLDEAPVVLVEWEATARRVRRSSLVLLTMAVVAWVVASVATGGWRVGVLGNLLGLALGAMFVVELVVVGGSAVRGLLRAGDRGERLSSHDVGLFPPRRRRDAD